MKKILSLAAIALFTMTSCSSDDSNETVNPENVLLKKTIFTDEDGEVETTTYTYDGNKITKIDYSDGGYEVFTYNNNLLTERLIYISQNELGTKYEFLYDSSNRLSSYKKNNPTNVGPNGFLDPYQSRTVFTYNSDNTITTKYFYTDNFGDGAPLEEVASLSTGTIVMLNGNITKDILADENGNGYTRAFDYDDKNNPLKNIVGYDALTLSEYGYGGGPNNITASHFTTTMGTNIHFTSTYEYNTNGYPTTCTEAEEGITQYFYE